MKSVAAGRKPNSVPLRETIIPLGPALLTGSSDLPGSFGRAVLKRSPIWSCSVRGFACHLPYSRRGALLPHLFTLTHLRPCGLRWAVYFLCHWSFRLPRPGVTRRTALWSSDFPLALRQAIIWPTATLYSIALGINPAFIRQSPAGSRTARASCRGCFSACR